MQKANSRPLGRSGRYGAKDLDTANIKHIHNRFVNSNDDMPQLKNIIVCKDSLQSAYYKGNKKQRT